MDRCRCQDYRDAVKSIKFYTVGTLRPDIIENHDRSGYKVKWVKNAVSYTDLRFMKPHGMKVVDEMDLPQNKYSPETWRKHQMWCRYMTPVVKE